jgi:uncharacterized protein YneF (UPF0154 family)
MTELVIISIILAFIIGLAVGWNFCQWFEKNLR